MMNSCIDNLFIIRPVLMTEHLSLGSGIQPYQWCELLKNTSAHA